MNLTEIQAKAKELGVRRGESASDFRKRDPSASVELSKWIDSNRAAIAQTIAEAVLTDSSI